MQQAIANAIHGLYFKLFGLEVFIERTQYDYPGMFAMDDFGAGERQFLLAGHWRVVCSW